MLSLKRTALPYNNGALNASGESGRQRLKAMIFRGYGI